MPLNQLLPINSKHFSFVTSNKQIKGGNRKEKKKEKNLIRKTFSTFEVLNFIASHTWSHSGNIHNTDTSHLIAEPSKLFSFMSRNACT